MLWEQNSNRCQVVIPQTGVWETEEEFLSQSGDWEIEKIRNLLN